MGSSVRERSGFAKAVGPSNVVSTSAKGRQKWPSVNTCSPHWFHVFAKARKYGLPCGRPATFLGRFQGRCVPLSQVSAAKSAAWNLGHPTVAAGYSLSETFLVSAAAELDDASAVTFGGSSGGESFELQGCFALSRGLLPGFAAGLAFSVERLGGRCRAAHIVQRQHLDLELAAVVRYLKPVAEVNFAGARGHRAGFEEAGGPEPLVDAHPNHGPILSRRLSTHRQGKTGGRRSPVR